MSTIRNGQISRHFNFNKIIKWPGTSFQSHQWARDMLEMLVIQHTSIWPNLILTVLGLKRNKHKCKFNYLAMLMMTLKLVDFSKKIHQLNIKGYFTEQNTFVGELTCQMYISIISSQIWKTLGRSDVARKPLSSISFCGLPVHISKRIREQ